MAVESVNVVNTISARVETLGSRTYEVLYRVITTSVNDNAIAAIRASGIPAIGEYYLVGNDYDTGAYVRSYDASLQSQDEDRKTWNVVVHFATSQRGDGRSDPTQNLDRQDLPWLMPARVYMSGIDREETTTELLPSAAATERILITNSAGDVVLDPVTIQASAPILTIEKDYLELPGDLLGYANCVNSATFFGQIAGKWRLTSPRIQRMFTGNGIRYYAVTYDFEYTDNNHVEIVDRGWFAKDPENASVRVIVTDGFGKTASEPMNLDGLGYQSAMSDEPVYFPPQGVWRYKQQNFALLNIPTDWDQNG